MLTLADIERARERVAEIALRTPLWPTPSLSEVAGAPVYLKLENLQRTGSFKIRGALNMLAETPEAARGVVAASAGNHAQGVALAARSRGIAATVVMPAGAPLAKQQATRGYGAEVVLVDGPLSEAQAEAQRLAVERERLYVPPYDHPAVVAGQGTVGLELLEQLPALEHVLVPAGGGGLLAGVALAVKTLRPEVRVVGVQTHAMPGILASLDAGEPVSVEPRRTIADGVGVAGPSALTYALIREHVDAIVTVTEDQVARAVMQLIERARLVVEGAGALSVAALLAGAVEVDGPTVAILSGGNIDVTTLDRLVQRALAAEGRRRTLTFAAANVPGELARVATAVAAGGANVVEVTHDLAPADLPVGVARIALRLEIATPEAYADLERSLLAAGFEHGVATDFTTAAAARWPE